jgi:crotonobetainyl-CoA:carnitine CoA-transferase CaiB-like acyl-CoA transferase
MGILIALLEREVSGEGQWVESSLLAAQIAMLDFQGARWTIAHEVPEQAGNDHPTSIPTGVFRTSDGYINIASAGDEIFGRFCRAIDRPDLAEHPDYKTGKSRSDNRKALNAAIDRLNKAGVPSGPIYKMDAVFADPQVKHLGIAQKVHHPKLGDIELVGQAVTLSRTPSRLKTASPDAGEHTDAILGELGYSAGDIARLRDNKVV